MAIDRFASVTAHESTPLLHRKSLEKPKYSKSVLYLALLCGFIVSLSFGVTQVPLIYVFRLMTCEEYYKTHPEPTPGSDRCGNHEIEAATAAAVGLLGASTTLFGVLNLFVTGWMIKRFGIKAALVAVIFWPAVRLAIQNIGVMTGGGNGIIIIQSSQIITVLGGPAGYLLALNSYVAEVAEPSERTGLLGKLQGCSFMGISIAYLIGGFTSDAFGILAPFRITLGLFLTSCLYVVIFLPWIPPNKAVAAEASKGFAKFFGPLKIFTPQKWTLRSGRVETQTGTIFLGIGVFLGVLATGYIPTLLQMYATDVYGFSTTENGYLISLNSFVRGLFLTLAFPPMISAGRSWLSNKKASKDTKAHKSIGSNIPDLPSQAVDFAEVGTMGNDEEPIEPPNLGDEQETFDFDLQYSRYSLLADAVLTGAATFVTQGWQLYLVAVLLPLASGTGASAKGTILQMCSSAERADALSAITLVEMVARLASSSVFGLVFMLFAQMGKINLIFAFDAAVALLGFGILLFSRFPPDGSNRLGKEQAHEEPQTI